MSTVTQLAREGVGFIPRSAPFPILLSSATHNGAKAIQPHPDTTVLVIANAESRRSSCRATSSKGTVAQRQPCITSPDQHSQASVTPSQDSEWPPRSLYGACSPKQLFINLIYTKNSVVWLFSCTLNNQVMDEGNRMEMLPNHRLAQTQFCVSGSLSRCHF